MHTLRYPGAGEDGATYTKTFLLMFVILLAGFTSVTQLYYRGQARQACYDAASRGASVAHAVNGDTGSGHSAAMDYVAKTNVVRDASISISSSPTEVTVTCRGIARGGLNAFGINMAVDASTTVPKEGWRVP